MSQAASTPAPAPAASAAGPGPACLSVTTALDPHDSVTVDVVQKARPRTQEVITESIRWLIAGRAESCLWVTITWPDTVSTYAARMATFRSWCANVGRRIGKSVWVPQLHRSGRMHLHGVLWVDGADFAAGFDHAARARWVVSRDPADLAMWKASRGPDLRRAAHWRRQWAKAYGFGFVDLCPLRPETEPIAIARYISRYVSSGGFVKGTRLVRRVGWKPGEDRPMRSNEFCFSGRRASLFGQTKERGLSAGVKPEGRGWALRAAQEGARFLGGHLPFTAAEQAGLRARLFGGCA